MLGYTGLGSLTPVGGARRAKQGVVAAVLSVVGVVAVVSLPAVAAEPAAPTSVAADYIIGPGDIVRVTVFQNPDLTQETRVSESGTITYPLLGQVKVGGLSARRAEMAIADGLKQGNFVRSPQVTVLVTQIRGNQASVLGQVNRPGRYPIEVAGMRLSQVLAAAGGITSMGSDVVVLTSTVNGRSVSTSVDIATLFSGSKGADSVVDPVVRDGDTLYVDRMPMVFIYGEVQRPGTFRLERDMTVIQGLASGGGLTAKGTQKGLRVHRRDASGAVKIIEPKMTDVLQQGDVIHVQESLF